VSRAALAVAAVAGVLAATEARGHEVLHSVERGRAVAVRAFFPDGQALGYAPFEVYSPADAGIPWQKGRTDRGGWLAFVPDVPGRWRVKVVDGSGHGLEVEVDAGSIPAVAGTASTAAFVLRPLLGLAAIGAVFALLFAVYRRKGSGR
jgi:nickel transport protein